MNTRTRKRVVIVLMALAVVAPIELVLLRAWSTPDPNQAIREYVAGLSPSDLQAAADVLGDFPFVYRREIMRALDLDSRARTWRRHVAAYVDRHPGLDSTARVVLEAAMALMTPTVFGQATAADREQMELIAEQTVQLLGREEADYLFYRLGPRDGKFASREPLSMRFANWVRGVALALADEETDCNCNNEYGCDGGATCKTGVTCTIDDDWPACGWFWNETCNGLCTIGSPQG